MNLPDILLRHGFAQFWQVTVLATLALVAARTVLRSRPQVAYCLCLLVVVKSLTPPIWSSPSSPFSWAQRGISGTSESFDAGAVAPATVIAVTKDVSTTEASEAVSKPPAAKRGFTWPGVLMWIWLAGVAFLTLIVMWRWLRLSQLVWSRGRPAEAGLADITTALAQRLGVRRPVRTLVLDAPSVPFVYGIFRGTVVVSRQFIQEKTHEELEPVIAHELAHFRRGDTIFGRFQLLSVIVWWFHPLVWLINRQATAARENCCDVWVVGNLGINQSRYARSLLDVIAHNAPTLPAAAHPALRPVELTAMRLKSIMQLSGDRRSRSVLFEVALVAVGACIVLPGAALSRPVTEANPTTNSSTTVIPTPEPVEDAPLQVVERTFTVAAEDGTLIDKDGDGWFEDVESKDFRVKLEDLELRDQNLAGVLEFPLSQLPPGSEVIDAKLTMRLNLTQYNSRPNSHLYQIEVSTYAADGKIDLADGGATVTPILIAGDIDVRAMKDIVISLPPEAIVAARETNGWLGLRLRLVKGKRAFFDSREGYSGDSYPRLTVQTRTREPAG